MSGLACLFVGHRAPDAVDLATAEPVWCERCGVLLSTAWVRGGILRRLERRRAREAGRKSPLFPW